MNYLDIHTHHLNQSQDITSVYVRDMNLIQVDHPRQCLGLHPWWIDQFTTADITLAIEKAILDNTFFALGEIGLDKSCKVDYEKQVLIFQQMLSLTKTLPIERIILHVVRAHSDILFWLKNFNIDQKILVHDFYAPLETARQYLKFDCYFSFGKKILNHAKAQNAWRELPINRIFLETDDDETALAEIYHVAANIREISLNDLKQQMHQNFLTFSAPISKT